MEPFEKNFPKLEGSEKQIAWAEDIRKRWIKENDMFEPMQRWYKEGVEDFKRRYEKFSPNEIEMSKSFAKGRKENIKAARFTLEHMTKAHDIIEHRNHIRDIVIDVGDAMKESNAAALEVFKDWML